MLLELKELIFKELPRDKAEAFAAAFPVDVDAPDVCDKLAILRLTRMLPTLDANPKRYAKECAAALRLVIESLAAESAESAARSAVESAAWSAAESAESAARSAAESAESAESAAWSAESAESAAWSAARSAWSAWSVESAARSAESAAWSAAWSAARSEESAAWSAHFEWEAATLLQLLRDDHVTSA